MNPSNEPINRFDGRPDFAVHAAAGVEKNADADGYIEILAEVGNLLPFAVFFENEIVCREVGNVSAVGIGDGCDDIHETDIDPHLCCQQIAVTAINTTAANKKA